MDLDWYIPITFIPGIALLVLSASNYILDLNRELISLSTKKPIYQTIIGKKVKQLRRLSRAVFCLYVSILLFSSSGLTSGLTLDLITLPRILLVLGIIFLTIGIGMLSVFSLLAVRIREEFLKIKK